MLKIRKPAIIIFGVSLIIMLPAFIMGSGGGDLIFHTLWSEHFHAQILAGNLYPRWLHNINSGCGEPVFFFYPPFAFYLNSLVQIVTGNKLDSWYSMSIVLFIAVLVGNIFLYLWTKDITASIKYALCAVVIFTLLPYKSVYIYYTFSYPQSVAAFCLLPAILFLINKYHNTRNNIFLVCYIIAQSFIFLTNIPSTIIMSGLPVLYYIFKMHKDNIVLDIFKLFLVIILSALLSAFFLLPLYELLPYLHIGNDSSHMVKGHLNFRVNFIDTANISVNYRPRVVNIIFMLFSISFFYKTIKSNISSKLKYNLIFWFAVNLICFCLMLSVSKPIWELIPILKHLQFPDRFAVIQAICLTWIMLLYLISRKDIKESIDKFMWPFLMITSVIAIINTTPRWSVKNDIISFSDPNSSAIIKKVHQMNTLYSYNKTIYSDYLPVYTNPDFTKNTIGSIEKLYKHCSTNTKVISGDANIQINKWQSRNIELAINSKANSMIHINQFYFPNWQAVDESGKDYEITPIDYYGTMQINVPEGKHTIKLTMPPFKSEIIGKYISLSTLFILLSYIIYYLRRKHGTTN